MRRWGLVENIAVVLGLGAVLSGCGNPEMEAENNRLKVENATLKQNTADLTAKIAKLSETDAAYWKRAMDARANGDLPASNKSLTALRDKFPTSPLLPKAKVALAQNRESMAAKIYAKGKAHVDAKEYGDAQTVLQDIVANFGDTVYADRARSLKRRAKRDAENALARADAIAEKEAAESQARADREEEAARRASAKLELLAFRWHRTEGGSFVEATGQIKNLTDETMKNVEASVTFNDANGKFVDSNDAIIEYSSLLPGQTSTWTVLESDNPEIKSAHVEFKTFDGEAIETLDSRD